MTSFCIFILVSLQNSDQLAHLWSIIMMCDVVIRQHDCHLLANSQRLDSYTERGNLNMSYLYFIDFDFFNCTFQLLCAQLHYQMIYCCVSLSDTNNLSKLHHHKKAWIYTQKYSKSIIFYWFCLCGKHYLTPSSLMHLDPGKMNPATLLRAHRGEAVVAGPQVFRCFTQESDDPSLLLLHLPPHSSLFLPHHPRVSPLLPSLTRGHAAPTSYFPHACRFPPSIFPPCLPLSTCVFLS